MVYLGKTLLRRVRLPPAICVDRVKKISTKRGQGRNVLNFPNSEISTNPKKLGHPKERAKPTRLNCLLEWTFKNSKRRRVLHPQRLGVACILNAIPIRPTKSNLLRDGNREGNWRWSAVCILFLFGCLLQLPLYYPYHLSTPLQVGLALTRKHRDDEVQEVYVSRRRGIETQTWRS